MPEAGPSPDGRRAPATSIGSEDITSSAELRQARLQSQHRRILEPASTRSSEFAVALSRDGDPQCSSIWKQWLVPLFAAIEMAISKRFGSREE